LLIIEQEITLLPFSLYNIFFNKYGNTKKFVT